ncbi:hypothetical protein [Niabella aurantiaca]|uniref:hypothetical protein n=1 Tax=Niabella aurantiaca TaxID=379900 RepID=UPI00037346B4|nr:hypothetical protein [Niabella aurantiaca]
MKFKNRSSYYNAGFSGWIGAAQKDITPPVGIYSKNWGAGNDSIKTGIHHGLCLTCIVFKSDAAAKPLILIAADLGWWSVAEDEQRFRQALLKAFELDEPGLMICFSHTHSGPNLLTENSDKPGGELIPGYLQQLQAQAIAAIQEAMATAEPGTLCWNYGKCGLARNRDQPVEDSSKVLVGFSPGKDADDTLLVGRATNEKGAIIATIVNYACHPTTLAWENKKISPDYIGAMRSLVQEQAGGLCLFLQGASGELAPAEQYSGNNELADRYGRWLGYAVLSILESMLPPQQQLCFTKTIESGASLAIWEKRHREISATLEARLLYIEMELKPLPSLQEIEARWKNCDDPVLKERLWRQRAIRRSLGEKNPAAIPLWIWRIGECCFIGQPNEAYSCFQQDLRQALSPFPVAVMNVVNGHIGYLPPAEMYDFDIYSVWQTPFAAGALEALTDAAATELRNIMDL